MSKNNIQTRDIIIDKAIKLYNLHGIEYVGVRELAKELHMKGGNITYYFPTKDDLVVEIANRLSLVNKDLLTGTENLSLKELLLAYKKIYTNQYNFRSIMISLPHLLKQNEKFVKNYKRNQVERRETVQKQINGLIHRGYIKKLTDEEFEALHGILTFNNRFWLSEATADNHIVSEEYAVDFAITRLKNIFCFVVTPKGKKDIDTWNKKGGA